MVTRLMASFFMMGQDQNYPPTKYVSFSNVRFDEPDIGCSFATNPASPFNEHVNVQGDHFKTIRAMGSASTVLLKHGGNLPLNQAKLPKSIGILGSDAGPNP